MEDSMAKISNEMWDILYGYTLGLCKHLTEACQLFLSSNSH